MCILLRRIDQASLARHPSWSSSKPATKPIPHQRSSADDESARVANPHQTPHTTHKAACTYYPSGAVGADLLHYGQREHLVRCFCQATIYTFAKTPESVADKTVRRDSHGDLWRDWSEHVRSAQGRNSMEQQKRSDNDGWKTVRGAISGSGLFYHR